MITYRVKLSFQSQEEKARMTHTLDIQRLAVNQASTIHFGNGEKRVNSIVELHAKFYKKFREERPECIADIVCGAENECLASYRSIKSNKHKIDKPIEKRRLSMRLNKNLCAWDLANNRIKLSCIGGKRIWASIEMYDKIRGLFQKYESCDPLIYERSGDLWLAVTFDNPKILPSGEVKAVGVDLGIRRIASLSNGQLLVDNKYLKEKRRLRLLKRQLQSCTATKRSKSAKRHLKRLRRKERNRTKNFCHHLVNKILQADANVIVIEDLSKIKERKGKKKYQNLNKLSQAPFYLIRQILTYKAPMHGKRVEVICPRDTSRIDYRTNLKDGERRGCRYYGKDGVVLDADLNAANNIVLKSELPDSCKALSSALDGQGLVTGPIVGRLRSDKFPILIEDE
jgi:putative transposase